MAAAKQADDATARNMANGVFHGVPINVKESFGVKGHPCTWGIPAFKNSQAPRTRLRCAGFFDARESRSVQRTCRRTLRTSSPSTTSMQQPTIPGSRRRTPEDRLEDRPHPWQPVWRSSVSVSDLAGSIRTPAAFCGVYGHKPTLDIVNMGAISREEYTAIRDSRLIECGRSNARAARISRLDLRILAGPEPGLESHQGLSQAAPPKPQDYVSLYFGKITVPMSAESKSVLEMAIRACENAGAMLKQDGPTVSASRSCSTRISSSYGAFDFSVRPPEGQRQARAELADRSDYFAKAASVIRRMATAEPER